VKILIATKNPAKTRELKNFLQTSGLEVLSLADFPDAPNIEETGKTFEENALLKAKSYYEWFVALSSAKIFATDTTPRTSGAIEHLEQLNQSKRFGVVADDGGLEIDALNGEPGVKSRRWPGHEANDDELIALALEKLNGVPWEKRTARFRIVLAFYDGARTETVTESSEGYITEQQRGSYEPGFPYRAIFWVPKFKKMFNELTPEEHEQVNHRRFACLKLRDKILALL